MKLLLVEDDEELVSRLRPLLRRAGYAVEWSGNGVDATFLAQEEDFDAIVLDLGLPHKPGLEVLRELRASERDTPLLILTARDSWQERVDGLRAGADDYLGKPFHAEELLARLEAILRRHHGQSENCLNHGGVSLDLDRQCAVDADGREIALTAIEFRLLRYLMLNPRKILSKAELSDRIYEEDRISDSNVIEVYINRLRKYFGKDFIHTQRGQGYCLQADSD